MWHSPAPSNSGHSCLICLPPSRLPPLSAYLPPPAVRPPVENAYYIVAVSGGTVLSNQPTGIRSQNAVNSDSQRWRVKYGDISHKDHVAIRNVSDGKWLRVSPGEPSGEVVTSNEKQWWIIEEGPSPGSCWLKCSDFEDAYLCNANGSHVDGNLVYATSKQTENAHAFTWTLRDADSVGYNAKSWQLSDCARGGSDVGGIEQQRTEMAEKERALDDKRTLILEQEKSLAAQEIALKKQIDDLAAKEADLQRQVQMHSSSSNTNIALLKTENDNLHLQLRTTSLEREVEKVKERVVSSNTAEQLRKLEVETGRLKAIVHAHERSPRSSPSPTKLRDSSSVFSSPSPTSSRPIHNPSSPLYDRHNFSLRSPPAKIPTLGGNIPSLTATPASPHRLLSRDSPSTPTRPSSLASGTPKSYDSRFSGWPDDDCTVPITPSKVFTHVSPSPMGSTPLRHHEQTRLPTAKTRSPTSTGNLSVSGKSDHTGLGISTSPNTTLSPAGSKSASKGTPAKEKLPHNATPNCGTPAVTLHSSDDGDAVIHPCGHKIYKPPRKLNRTVAGYLYE